MSSIYDKKISYEVVRSERATADIVIERDGSVVVRAPAWVNDEQVENIVRSKYYWIYKGLAEWRDLNATRVLREYKSGEGFLYLGRNYRLMLSRNQEQPLVLRDGRFVLRLDLVETGGITAAQKAFRDFYVDKGTVRLGERIDYFAWKVGVQPKSFQVRELGHRWASCSPVGKLAFHWKCMMAPPKIIDYIVVHELCHIHFRHHTDAFWNEVDKVLGDYRERKDWLKRNGAGLDV